MGVAFIVNHNGKLKHLNEMTSEELTKLKRLLSGPVQTICKSEVKVAKNNFAPVYLYELNANSLSLLQNTVNNYCSGYITKIDMCFDNKEKELVFSLMKNNSNVCQTARSLTLTRDEVRGAIKRFKTKWNIDLATNEGLNRAYSIAVGC